MSLRHYILDGKLPLVEPDFLTWCKWFEKADRHVAEDWVDGSYRVSTVFLGLNHRFSGKGAPILFETIVFNGKSDGAMRRYCTWDEAVLGHQEMIEDVKRANQLTA